MSRSLVLFSLVAALLSLRSASATNDDQKTYYGHHKGHGHHSPPSTPSPSHGSSGGSTPSTPKECPTPSVPSKSPPSSGHGSTSHPSPTPTPYVPTPSVPTPSVPTPSVPTPYVPTPSVPTPYVPTPSVPTPYVPTPSVPTPSVPTPFIPDPNTPPFTCTYWKNHPQLIWGVLGWFGTVGNTFGVPNVPGMGSGTSLKDVLSNTRTDAYSELCRQATAALLNSMVDHHFSLSAKQVRDSFVAALPSDKTAAIQANLFRLANEAKH